MSAFRSGKLQAEKKVARYAAGINKKEQELSNKKNEKQITDSNVKRTTQK